MGQLKIHCLVMAILIVITQMDYTTALYGSETNCALKNAYSVTCPSSGVSNPGAVIGNFITSTTIYVTVTSARDNIYTVARCTYSYLPGVTAGLSFDEVIGYVILSNDQPIAYLNVVNCPSISRFNNTNTVIPYTRTLTYSILYQSISIGNQPQRGPCNIFPAIAAIDSPASKSNLDPGAVVDLDGISSIQVAQLGTSSSYIKRVVQASVGGINVEEDSYRRSVFVTQKQSRLTAPCFANDLAGTNNSYSARIAAYTQAALNNPDAPGVICKIVTVAAERGVAIPIANIGFSKLILIQPPDRIVVIVGYTLTTILVADFVSFLRGC